MQCELDRAGPGLCPVSNLLVLLPELSITSLNSGVVIFASCSGCSRVEFVSAEQETGKCERLECWYDTMQVQVQSAATFHFTYIYVVSLAVSARNCR